MQAKACFLKHELSRINHELTINGWRGVDVSQKSQKTQSLLSTFNNQ